MPLSSIRATQQVDRVLRDRLYDQINPMQNDKTFSTSINRKVAAETKSPTLDVWYIPYKTKPKSFDGNRNDSNEAACSDTN